MNRRKFTLGVKTNYGPDEERLRGHSPRPRPYRGHSPLEEVPDDCGYGKKFKFDIDMQSNGIMGDCIEWCQKNCKSKWGWWFDGPAPDNPYDHNWEEQNSYMSFEDKREAMAFFLASGMANMGDHSR